MRTGRGGTDCRARGRPYDGYLLQEVERVHKASNDVYGQLKVWDELNDQGSEVARCTVERLMRAHAIEGRHNTKTQRSKMPGPSPAAADDLGRRDFSASRPDEVWLMDFSCIRACEGWCYGAVVLDIFTRPIASWQMASHTRQSLVSDALELAIASRRPASSTTLHSDSKNGLAGCLLAA